MNSILLYESKKGFVQLKLLDTNKKTLTHSDINISKDFLYQFGADIIDKIASDTISFLDQQEKISKSLLYDAFAYFFIYNSNEAFKDKFYAFTRIYLESIVKDFGGILNILSQSSDPQDLFKLELFNIDSCPTVLNSHQKSLKSTILSFYGNFFHLEQFTSQEGLYNASSQITSLLPKYVACGEGTYLDGLYYYQVDRIGDYESSNYQKLRAYKGFSQTYEKDIIFRVNDIFTSAFKALIKRKDISSIAVIPNNQERPTSTNQIIKDTLFKLYPSFEHINILKNTHSDTVAQKSIKVFCDRLTNADLLFNIDPKSIDQSSQKRTILLIDDVFGSGATMNMTAKKIKKLLPNAKIIGFAILGSYRTGFDIINEV